MTGSSLGIPVGVGMTCCEPFAMRLKTDIVSVGANQTAGHSSRRARLSMSRATAPGKQPLSHSTMELPDATAQSRCRTLTSSPHLTHSGTTP
jgi:hypothetical protein